MLGLERCAICGTSLLSVSLVWTLIVYATDVTTKHLHRILEGVAKLAKGVHVLKGGC